MENELILIQQQKIKYDAIEVAFQEHQTRYPELKTYSLKTFNYKKVLGQCDYSKRTILISMYHLKYSTYEEVLNTLKHEIAHAINYARNGNNVMAHGKEWKRICVEVGARPERLNKFAYNIQKPPHNYEAVCGHCGKVFIRYRFTSTSYSCDVCSNEFNPNYLLNYVKIK